MKTCIVGTGLGGGTLACEMVRTGHSVTSIEAGSEKPSDTVSYENVGREFGLRSTRAIQLGGTSNLWHGVLAPLDPIDFERREHVPHSGWPISLSDLAGPYQRAAAFLGLGDNVAFDLEKVDPVVAAHARDFEFDHAMFRNKLFRQRVPPRRLLGELQRLKKTHGTYRCITQATALELVNDNGRVVAAKLGRPDGSIEELKADLFVVAAGALETPRLLLNSGVINWNLGRFLMDHPMGNLCQIRLPTPVRAPLYSDMRVGPGLKLKSGLELHPDFQRRHGLLNHNFYLRPSFAEGIDNESDRLKLMLLSFRDGKVTFRELLELARNFNVVAQILIYKLSLNAKYRYADLFFVTEQAPNEDSCVALSERRDRWGYRMARVNWQVPQAEVDQLYQWFDLCIKGGLSQDYVFTHRREDLDWPRTFSSAAHHVGTCRMAESPEHGVVSGDLKVFGFDNLYVCDGSVFPTGGNVNSGLTIAALAMRLATHLGKVRRI